MAIMAILNCSTGNTISKIPLTKIPLPNKIKSKVLNSPKINLDFFELAGIKNSPYIYITILLFFYFGDGALGYCNSICFCVDAIFFSVATLSAVELAICFRSILILSISFIGTGLRVTS